jgi:hypothetical protein
MTHIIEYLAKQDSGFRGSASKLYESCSRNFLKMVEMIGKFYPVMTEHVQRIQK